jgi:hypothetical protein
VFVGVTELVGVVVKVGVLDLVGGGNVSVCVTVTVVVIEGVGVLV